MDGYILVVGAILCTLSLSETRDLQTCLDVVSDLRLREQKIERLKTQLEEYRIIDQNNVEEVQDECNTFDSCSTCVHVGSNLNCGWCFLYSRCTLQEHCPGAESNVSAWIAPERPVCPRIRKVVPQYIPLGQPAWLQIHIPHMPPYEGDLICSFQALGKFVISKALRTEEGVKCWSYIAVELPENKQSEPVAVSVRLPGRVDLVSAVNFTIFNCHNYKSCTECTSSPFPCSWCLNSNQCTHDVNGDCKKDNVIDGVAISQLRIRKGQEYCAKIIPNSLGGSNEILVPVFSRKRIHIKIEHITTLITSSRFYCSIPGHEKVDAQLLGDTVYCMDIQLKTLDHNPISSLPVNIMWSGGYNKLDNPFNVHVLVFDCSLLATSCGTCLDLPERYNCGWCEGSNSCAIQDQCQTDWLIKDQRCIKPEILRVIPKAAIINKNTNITIEGVNFGRRSTDIHVRLVSETGDTIAKCDQNHELYITSTKISCLLEAPVGSLEGNETISGFFEVLLWNQHIAVSNEDFAFVEPSITSINPIKGTKSGGTVLKIHGHHLEAGNNVEVLIADSSCKIIYRDASTIQCVTTSSKRTLSSAVKVIFDGVEKFSPVYYFYVEDPWVRSVQSECCSDGPRGTPSGGNIVSVEGDYFDHLTEPPYFYLVIDDEQYIGTCTIISASQMTCLTPRVPAEKLHFCGEEGFLLFDYGFMMDHVTDVQNISFQDGFKKFKMFPDPYFLPFQDDGKIKVFNVDYLVIKGFNIDSVYSDDAIAVEIGNETCSLTSLSHSQLTCKPPVVQPASRYGSSKSLPEVVVKVFDSMEFFVGFLRYTS